MMVIAASLTWVKNFKKLMPINMKKITEHA